MVIPRGAGASFDGILAFASELLFQLQALRSDAQSLGHQLAATYVEGAVDAVRAALEALPAICVARTGRMFIGRHELEICMREGGDAFALGASTADLGHVVSDCGVHIGHAIGLAGDFLNAMRDDDVVAAMVYMALAECDWIAPSLGQIYYGSSAAAEAIIGTLIGRTTFPRWRSPAPGLVHDNTQELLNSVGWRRLSGLRLPTSPAGWTHD